MSITKTTGPEGSAESAVVFNGSSYLLQANESILSGEFTILFWVSSVDFATEDIQHVVSIVGADATHILDVYFDTDAILYVGDAIATPAALNVGWKLYAAIRNSSDDLLIYEDGVQIGSASAFSGSFGGISIRVASADSIVGSELTLSGLKIVPRAYSEDDLLFHISDTLNDAGRVSWP